MGEKGLSAPAGKVWEGDGERGEREIENIEKENPRFSSVIKVILLREEPHNFWLVILKPY